MGRKINKSDAETNNQYVFSPQQRIRLQYAIIKRQELNVYDSVDRMFSETFFVARICFVRLSRYDTRRNRIWVL